MSKATQVQLQLHVEACPKGGFLIRGAKQNLRTPSGADLVVPTQNLALALCEEVKQQGRKGSLYRLSAMLADIIVPQAEQAREELSGFLETDLVLYRAPEPADLVVWESQHWDGVLNWATGNGFGYLPTTNGLQPISLPEMAHRHLAQQLEKLTPEQLLVCVMATRLAGSVLSGLMFTYGLLDSRQLYTIAAADELYQLQRYSEPVDSQLQALQRLENSLNEIAHFQMLSAMAIAAK